MVMNIFTSKFAHVAAASCFGLNYRLKYNILEIETETEIEMIYIQLSMIQLLYAYLMVMMMMMNENRKSIHYGAESVTF